MSIYVSKLFLSCFRHELFDNVSFGILCLIKTFKKYNKYNLNKSFVCFKIIANVENYKKHYLKGKHL